MHHSQFEHLFPELWELCHLQGLRFGPRAMFCTYGTTLNQFVAWTLYEEIDWLHDHKSGWNIYHSGIKSVQKNTLSRNVLKAKLVLYRWDYFSRLFFYQIWNEIYSGLLFSEMTYTYIPVSQCPFQSKLVSKCTGDSI